jgi:hypothetical protein
VEASSAQLADALASAPEFLRTAARIGVIVQKAETRPKHDGGEEQFCTFQVVNILCFFLIRKINVSFVSSFCVEYELMN